MPVQRVERQHQRARRPAASVQNLADGDRLTASRRFLGDVEIRPQRQPDAGHLALGRPGKGGEQLGARVKRLAGQRVAANRGRARILEDFLEAASRAVGRGYGVGQADQIGRGAHQPGHPRSGLGVGTAREQPDPPQPRRGALPHLGVTQVQPASRHRPFGKSVRVTRRELLALGQLIGYFLDSGRAQGFGQEQPAERSRPHRKQAFFQRRGRSVDNAMLIIRQQPVAYPGNCAPGWQPRHQAGQRAGEQWLGSRATRQRKENFLAGVAAHQARARGEQLDRAAGTVPYPANGQGSRAIAFSLGSGVIRGDQGGQPLGPARIYRLVLRRPCHIGLGASRDFGNPVRLELVQRVPS